MIFTITKVADKNFNHFDGFMNMNFSNWEIIFNNTKNTLILQMRNGAPFPLKEVLATDVIIIDDTDSGSEETFPTVSLIRTRLIALGYNALVTSGGSGGSVDSVNGQTGTVELDADDIDETTTRKWQSANQDTFNDATSSIQTQLDGKQATLTETSFGSFANGLNAKTTLVDADLTDLVDSADSNKSKKVTWLNVWNYIKSKADAIYSSLNPRVQTITSSATVTPTSLNDIVTITAQATGLTLANPTGTFAEGQALMIRIKDNGTAQSIAFGTDYRAIGITLPTTTVISKTLYLGIIYNSTDAKWDVLGINQQA